MQDLLFFSVLVLALIWVYKWGRSFNITKKVIEIDDPWTKPIEKNLGHSNKKKTDELNFKIDKTSTWQEMVKKYGAKPTAETSKKCKEPFREEKIADDKFEQYRGEYFINKGLFTATESKFMNALQMALSDDYLITAKFRVVDVIGVRRSNKDRKFYTYFNKVKAKHFDFVLCDKHNFSYVAAIELDDSSHQRPDRVERDNFLNEICAHTGFPLIRIKANYQYNPDEIRRLINQKVKIQSSSHPN